MKDKLNDFLKQNPTLAGLKLPARVVVSRPRLSAADITAIRKAGIYTGTKAQPELSPEEYQFCVGDLVLAVGKIIQKEGSYYFQASDSKKEETK